MLKYPRNLWTYSDEELDELGLARDEIGQIVDAGADDGRRLVCAVTGHAHKSHLVPLPVPIDVPGEDVEDLDGWGFIFVSEHAFPEAGRAAASKGIRYGVNLAKDTFRRILTRRVGGFLRGILG